MHRNCPIIIMDTIKSWRWLLDVSAVLLCLSGLLVLRWFFSRPKNLPPGPREFPVLGSIPALLWEVWRGLEPHQVFGKYAAKHGPVFRVKVLNKTLVVLNDYSSVKEAFQHPQLNDRPRMILAEAMKSSGKSVHFLYMALLHDKENTGNFEFRTGLGTVTYTLSIHQKRV